MLCSINRKLIAVILVFTLIFSFTPIGISADTEVNDTVENGYVKGQLIVEDGSVALKLTLWWRTDQDYGSGLFNLDTLIPDVIAKYNENHIAGYTKSDINKIIVIGDSNFPSSLNGFIQYLRGDVYANNLVELDLSESYFISWSWNDSHTVETDLFAGYNGNSYFPNLKVLKLNSLNVSAISFNAFNNMTSLETLELPDAMISIDSQALLGCTALKSISYHGSADSGFYNDLLTQMNEYTAYSKVDFKGSTISTSAALAIKETVTYIDLRDCLNIDYNTEDGEKLSEKLLKIQRNGGIVYSYEESSKNQYECADTVTGTGGQWNESCRATVFQEGDLVAINLHFVTQTQEYTGKYTSDATPKLDLLIPKAVSTYNQNHSTEIAAADITKMVVTGVNLANLALPEFIRFLKEDIYAKNLIELDLSGARFAQSTTPSTTERIDSGVFATYNGASNFPKLKVLKLGGTQFNTLEHNAFNNMTTLETIELPNSLKKISQDVFSGCSSLKSIDFPDTFVQMGDRVFSGCDSLESWSYHGSAEGSTDASAFYRELLNKMDVTMYSRLDLSGSSITNSDLLPALRRSKFTYINLSGCKNLDYTSTDGKKLYNKLKELIASGVTVIMPENLGWIEVSGNDINLSLYVEKTYYDTQSSSPYDDIDDIRGMAMYVAQNAIDEYNRVHSANISIEGITKLTVKTADGVFLTRKFNEFIKQMPQLLEIDMKEADVTTKCFSWQDADDYTDNALYDGYFSEYTGTTLTKVKKIVLPDSMEIINNYCFKGLSSLETIVFGNNVKQIGYEAFQNCSSLAALTLPKSLKTFVGDTAWYLHGCTSLAEISYQGNTGDKAFYTSLASMIVNSAATRVVLNGSGIDVASVYEIAGKSNISYLNISDCPLIEYISDDGEKLYTRLNSLKNLGKTVIMPDNTAAVYRDGSNVVLQLSFYRNYYDNQGSSPYSDTSDIRGKALAMTNAALTAFNGSNSSSLTKNSITVVKVQTAEGVFLTDCFGEFIRDTFANITEIDLQNARIKNVRYEQDNGNEDAISDDFFGTLAKVKKLTLPNVVKNIGADALDGLTSLTALAYHGELADEDIINIAGKASITSVDFSNSGITAKEALSLAKKSGLKYINLNGCINIAYQSEDGRELCSQLDKLYDANIEVITSELTGDINGDGFFDIRDLIHIKKYLSQVITRIFNRRVVSDFDNDSKVDVTEMVAIRRALLGVETLNDFINRVQNVYTLTVSNGSLGKFKNMGWFITQYEVDCYQMMTPEQREQFFEYVFEGEQINYIALIVEWQDYCPSDGTMDISTFMKKYYVGQNGLIDEIARRGIPVFANISKVPDWARDSYYWVATKYVDKFARTVAKMAYDLKNTCGLNIANVSIGDEPDFLSNNWEAKDIEHYYKVIPRLKYHLNTFGMSKVGIIGAETCIISEYWLNILRKDENTWNNMSAFSGHDFSTGNVTSSLYNATSSAGKDLFVSSMGILDEFTVAGDYFTVNNNGQQTISDYFTGMRNISALLHNTNMGANTIIMWQPMTYVDSLNTLDNTAPNFVHLYYGKENVFKNNFATSANYEYYSQVLNTVKPGADIYQCSVNGYGTMSGSFENCILNANAGLNADGTWGINIFNKTDSTVAKPFKGMSYAPVPQSARKINIRLDVKGLYGSGSQNFKVYATNPSGDASEYRGTITLIDGKGYITVDSLEMISLRSCESIGLVN